MKKFIALSLTLTLVSTAYADGLLPSKQEPVKQGTVKIEKSADIEENGNTKGEDAQTIGAPAFPVFVSEDDARDMITVTYTPIPMKSKLKKMYTAYQVTLASDYPNLLQVSTANITNGTPGTAASQAVYTSKANMWWGALLGIAGVIVVGLPILGVISSSNNKAEKESIQFPNQIPVTELSKGDSVTFNALTLLGQTPQIRLAVKDPKTKLSFTKNAR